MYACTYKYIELMSLFTRSLVGCLPKLHYCLIPGFHHTKVLPFLRKIDALGNY